MTDRAAVDRSARVGILAPTGRDGDLAVRVLARWNIEAKAYREIDSLVDGMRHGVGAMILAEEALVPSARDVLIAEIERQPSWSDLPLIVLTAEGELSRAIAQGIERIASRSNVTLLERPVRLATLITTVQSALRARARQYDVRDHLVALSAARAEAEEANRAKVEFLAMMSHELRTPLNAIGGYAELMEMGIHGAVNDEQREDLARIQRSQRHLLGLINGVLNFARIERGTVDYRISRLSMGELLASVESLVAPQAATRKLDLTFDKCTPSLVALGDREKVQQILLNLVGNAIKFTEPGGQVRMRCARQNDRITVTVEDTGRGIPPDKLEAVFEPFVQVDSRLTRSQDGVGLGLAISRDLALGMGGDLRAESELGVGSRFTLTLKAG
jgi:signal transduction histidine kinase